MIPPRLPITLRLTVGLARTALALLRLAAPASMRARWTEEWQAEIEQAAARVAGRTWAALRLLAFVAGMVPDAGGLHRLPRTAAATAGTPSWSPATRASRLHATGQDVRYAARNLTAAPAFTVTVVASLSIGIASMAGAFAFVNAALFPTLPGITDQHRLVEIMLFPSRVEDSEVLRDAIPGLSGWSASAPMRVAVGARGEVLSVLGALASPNYFDVLGVRMAAGRPFTAGDDRPADATVAVIGHGLTQRLFGSAVSAVGELITVGGHPVQIVGVAAEGFRGTALPGGTGTDIWLPSALTDRAAFPGRDLTGLPLPTNEINYVGRLSASSSIDEVLSQAQAAAAHVAAPPAEGQRGRFTRVRRLAVDDTSGLALDIAVIMLVPLLVLLIGCINAANLLLARGMQRGRDIAVRLALGASRWRVVRQTLAECMLLALLSAAAALALLAWALDALEVLVLFPMAVDLRVVTFAVTVSLASVVAFGLAPALRLSSANPGAALGSSRGGQDGSRSRMRQGLVAAQVALALGLLATGGQLITAARQLGGITGAQDPSTLLMVSFDLAQLDAEPAAAEAFYGSLLERVQRLPGVERAGLARGSALWMFGGRSGNSQFIAWSPGAAPGVSQYVLGGYVAGDLFEAVGVRLLQGRTFQPADRTERPRVALVNRTAADRYFDGNPVGQSIRVAARGQRYDASQEVQIVGVVESVLEPYSVRDLKDPSYAGVYLPARLEDEPALTLYVRARDTAAGLLAGIRKATDAVDPRVPFISSMTLAERQYERQIEDRLAAQGLTTLGLLGLALACGGLYGMVSFIVSMRRREIGVRMALGAEPRGIMRLVLKQGMNTALLGAAVGGGTAVTLSIVLRANMYGVPPMDAGAFAGTVALLSSAVLLASLVPALRAARVDPMVVLRDE